MRHSEDPDSRFSDMLAFGRDGLLDADQIANVTQYVLSLSGADHDASAAAAGAEDFAFNCAVCHGDDGAGVHELGAPAINDAVWLYGGTAEEIAAQIDNPRHGVMPGWIGRLDPVVIRQLALYVHALGGGEAAEQ